MGNGRAGSLGTEEPDSVRVDPDAVGTSSNGAVAHTAVNARTLTPSLVRVMSRWSRTLPVEA
jgi:hypothetical protein